MPGHRADPDLAVLLADVAELAGESVDVDQVLGRRQPELHHRQQRMAARQQPGVRPERSQQLERVVDTRGSLVFKRRWNLQQILSASPET